MMKNLNMKKTTLALLCACAMGTNAFALTIVPDDWKALGTATSQSEIDDFVLPFIAPATELYKQDVGGGESGSLSGSYSTSFANSPTDPQDATITYDGGSIVGPNAWMLVKDGIANPGWYLFDLTALGWDGMETLELVGFWPDQGAISHVTLYGTPGSTSVPDGGATGILLGSGLLGLGWFARRRNATKTS